MKPIADLKNFACEFDGVGTAKSIPIDDTNLNPKLGFTWVQLVQSDPQSAVWLDNAKLPTLIQSALTASETRPRCTPHGEGTVIILRGVNLNDGAKPEDMISVRLWVTKNLIVSYSLRPLKAVEDAKISSNGPNPSRTTGEFLGRLTQRLADRAEPTITELNEQLDVVEEAILEEGNLPNRSELAEIRRSAITLRRYMMPQRDALTTLIIEDLPWVSPLDLNRLREATDHITLLAECIGSGVLRLRRHRPDCL